MYEKTSTNGRNSKSGKKIVQHSRVTRLLDYLCPCYIIIEHTQFFWTTFSTTNKNLKIYKLKNINNGPQNDETGLGSYYGFFLLSVYYRFIFSSSDNLN